MYCARQVLKGPDRPFIAVPLNVLFTYGISSYTTTISGYVYKHIIVFDIYNEIITALSTSNPNIEKLFSEAIEKGIPIEGKYHEVYNDRILTHGNIRLANVDHYLAVSSLINEGMIYLWLAYTYLLTTSLNQVSNSYSSYKVRSHNSFIPSTRGGNDYGIMGVVLGKLKGGREIAKDNRPYYPGDYYTIVFEVDALACGIQFLTDKLMCRPITFKVLFSKSIPELPQDIALLFLYHYPHAKDSLPLVIGYANIVDQALSYYLLGKSFVLAYIRNAIALNCNAKDATYIDRDIIESLYTQLYNYLYTFSLMGKARSISPTYILISNLEKKSLMFNKGRGIVHVPYNVFMHISNQSKGIEYIAPNLVEIFKAKIMDEHYLRTIGAAFKSRYCCYERACQERNEYNMMII